MFEGDMILPRTMVKQAVEEGYMVKKEARIKEVSDGDAQTETETITAPLFMRWTNGVVPYVVHKDLSKLHKQFVRTFF